MDAHNQCKSLKKYKEHTELGTMEISGTRRGVTGRRQQEWPGLHSPDPLPHNKLPITELMRPQPSFLAWAGAHLSCSAFLISLQRKGQNKKT